MFFKLSQIFYFSIILVNITLFRSNGEPICNITKVIENHRKSFNYPHVVARYVPNKSCFICLKPSCNFKNPKCEKSFEFKNLPYYYKIFEFGLFGTDLPQGGYVQVPINEKCYLMANVTILPTNFMRDGKDISGYNLQVDFHQCKYSTKSCFTTDHVGSKYLGFDASCVFIGIIMKDRDKLYGSMSDDCLILSTAIRKNIYEIIVDDPECFYDEKFPPGNISMKFYYSERQPHEALTLILPCTSGGYLVNPISGRLATDLYCRSLYYTKCDGSTIEELAEELFDSNENLLFPIKKLSYTNKIDNFRPVYIDKNGKAKSVAEMTAKVVPDKHKQIIGRKGCFLLIKKGLVEIYEGRMPRSDLNSEIENLRKDISGSCLTRFPDFRITALILVYYCLLKIKYSILHS